MRIIVVFLSMLAGGILGIVVAAALHGLMLQPIPAEARNAGDLLNASRVATNNFQLGLNLLFAGMSLGGVLGGASAVGYLRSKRTTVK